MAVENMGISLGGRSPPRLTPNTKQGVNLSKLKGYAMSMKLTDMLSYKVDWLSFTKKCRIDESKITIDKILDYLGYDRDLFKRMEHGRYFYNAGITLGNYLNIYFNEANDKLSENSPHSVSFQFTGVGTTDLADRLAVLYDNKEREQNWIRFFKWLYANECKPNRIDLALDDFSGKDVNFDLMIRKLKAGHYRSVKKTYSINRGADQKGNVSGLTIYIGKNTKTSRGSYYARFYLKLQEFQSKGQLPPEIARETGVWNRFEIAFSKQKARNVIDKIIETGSFGKVYFGVLRSIVEFLNPKRGKDGKVYENKDFWSVCPWWEKFLRHAETVRVGSDDVRSIELADLLKYIRVQVVPSLRLLEQLGQHTDPEFDIYHMIKMCDIDQFSKKQIRLYNNALAMPPELLELYLKQFLEGY